MGFIAVQGNLTLEENTGRKFLAHRAAVYSRTGRIILITAPYGAFRTPQQQGYLRSGWEKGLPGFYYAAPVGDSNHEDGCAYDINNWAAVGEQVIKEEAWRLNLVRDPSERWHWNNLKGPNFYYGAGTTSTGGTVFAGVDNGKVLITMSWGDNTTHPLTGKKVSYGQIVQSEPAEHQNTRDAVTKLLNRVEQIHTYENMDDRAYPSLVRRILGGILDGVGKRIWEHGLLHYSKGVGYVQAADYLVGAEMSSGKTLGEVLNKDHGLEAIAELIKERGAPTSVSFEVDSNALVKALSDPRVASALGPAIGEHVVTALHNRTAPKEK